MKTLLLNPPYLKGFVRISRCYWLPITGSQWYPIFLAYCAGWLEKHGHQIKLVDAIAENLSHQQTINLAKEYQPKLLILYTSTQSLKNDVAVGGRIKKATGCLVALVGPGPWCVANSEKTLAELPTVDIIVKQEFDKPVLAIANGTPLAKIKGITWRKGKKITSNPGADFISAKELDEFPPVTKIYKEHLPIKKYYQASLLHPFVDLFTARGCAWGKCTFCLWPQTIQEGGLYRPRSIDNVIKELKYIQSSLPEVKEIFFQDDMLPAKRARELSEAIIGNGLKIVWSGYAKANLPYSILCLMKKSGCRFLHVGFESADPQILRNIKKGITRKQMEKFIFDAKRARLQVHGDFIVGLPGETVQTIRDTISWAKAQDIEAYQFSVPEANQSTELYNWLKDKGYLTDDNKPSYPHLSIKEIDAWHFRAMRELHLRPKYLLKILWRMRNPAEFFRLIRTAFYTVPNLLFPKKVTK